MTNPVALDWPTITVEAGFGYGPADGVTSGITWTDISDYCRGWTINRGKQLELQPAQAGSLQLKLNNRDRRFEPEYTSSPYYPYIRPGTPIRISGKWAGTTYYRGVFYANEWPVSWNGPLDSTVTVSATDFLGFLNRAKLNTSYASQTTGERISAVLNSLNYTTGVFWDLGSSALATNTELFSLGSIDTGYSDVQASTLTNVTALSHIQEVEATELGRFFFNLAGIPVFYSRQATGPDRGNFTDDVSATSNLNYENLDGLAFTDNDIKNDVTVTREGGTAQEATDTTSQTNYGTVSYALSTLATTDTEALYMAQWLVTLFKDPHLRIRSFTVRPRGNPNYLWPAVLPIDLSDKVTVTRTPPPSGAAVSDTYLIQGYQETVTKSSSGWDWTLQFYTGPATEYGWIVGTSILDTDTVAAF